MTTKNEEDFYCQECGKRFRTVKAAEKAFSVGCPKCGGCDIDQGKRQEGASIWALHIGALAGAR